MPVPQLVGDHKAILTTRVSAVLLEKLAELAEKLGRKAAAEKYR